MKSYKGIVGAAGVAVSLGLFAYANHDAVYEESETEEFPEENPEYAPELPAEEAAPYAQEDDTQESEEKTIKDKRDSPGNKNKKRTAKNSIDRHSFLKPSGLEKALEEEEEEERPKYDLQPEERENLTERQLIDYWDEALSNQDYKVAETYSSDLKKRYETWNEKNLFDECYISDAYDEYLSNILENCKKYDYDSVFRKVIWMDIFFIPKYEKNILNCKIYHVAEHDRKYIKKFNPFTLISKGNQALEAVEYCIEKRTP